MNSEIFNGTYHDNLQKLKESKHKTCKHKTAAKKDWQLQLDLNYEIITEKREKRKKIIKRHRIKQVNLKI